MDRILIVGAGGFGREVHAWASQHPRCGAAWRIAGFLDDDPEALGGLAPPAPRIGSVADYQPAGNERLICAIGDPATKRRVCESLRERGARFMSLVHPTVVLGADVDLGEGVILCPRVTLTANVRLGDFVAVNCHSSIGHDVAVGAWSTLSGHCDVTGAASLGEGAFLGSGARVLPGRSLGDWSKAGAGAVVLRSVARGQTVFGNPAQAIRG